ncbi:MAG: sigma-70 family RNA polymerase sigma factor [Candidatus Omnitrophota bacterium]
MNDKRTLENSNRSLARKNERYGMNASIAEAVQAGSALMAEAAENPDALSLRLWKNGNMRGYNELVQRYERPLIHFILRMIRDADEAKDILQETFVRLYRSLAKLREDKSLKAWLYQTANNLCIDWLRKRKPDKVFAADHQDPSFHAMVEESSLERPKRPDDCYQDQWLQEKIILAMEQLPKKQRTVMTLRSCKGLSIKEIAEILDCNEGTVGTTLFAARQKLMKVLKPVLSDYYGESFAEML